MHCTCGRKTAKSSLARNEEERPKGLGPVDSFSSFFFPESYLVLKTLKQFSVFLG